MASNPGNIAGQVGAGLGMGGGAAANVLGTMANQMLNSNIPVGQDPTSVSAEDPMEKLAKLKKMLDAGLIEQFEYDAKKSEILSTL